MKYFMNKIAASFLWGTVMSASWVLAGCEASDFDFDDGWDVNRADSSAVTVDTIQGIDVSMYEKARLFPGLVDTLTEHRIADTLVELDLSRTYAGMEDLCLKRLSFADKEEAPQPIYSTGLYAGTGELVTIYVPEGVWGLTVQIGMQTEDLTNNNAGLREPIVYIQKALYPGKNTVRSSLGGYIWILRDRNTQGLSGTEIKFCGVYAAPDFIVGETDKAEWEKKIRTTTVPWLDIRGKHVTFSVERSRMEMYLTADPAFAGKMEQAVSSVIRSAYSSGYKVIVFENGEDYEQEVKICQFLQKSGIDGLVVAPARTTNDLDHFVKLQHEGIPMVFFDRIAPNLDTDRVLEDDYKGACTVVRHMIDGGCRKIAHIALPRRYLWAQKREKGYLQALKDRHLFTDEKLIVECEDVSEVYRITRQLVLHSGVDGIFAANDAFAVHVLSVLRQMKCRVPEEVAVCGYGNEPSTEVTFPALTTVNKDGYRVGNIAAGLLIRRIEDKEEVPTVTRLLKPELIVRDSTLSVDR